MVTFLEYLAKRWITKNPTRDFTREARKDPGMGKIESWPQLQVYLFRQAHGRRVKEIIDAAEPVWKGYRAHVLKNSAKIKADDRHGGEISFGT